MNFVTPLFCTYVNFEISFFILFFHNNGMHMADFECQQQSTISFTSWRFGYVFEQKKRVYKSMEMMETA